jgi:hypothetical protein
MKLTPGVFFLDNVKWLLFNVNIMETDKNGIFSSAPHLVEPIWLLLVI